MARTAKITKANVGPRQNVGGAVGNTPVRAQDFNDLAGDYVSQTDASAQAIASQLKVRGELITNPGAPDESIGTGNKTLTIAQVLTQILEEDPAGAATWTLPTAALAVAGISGVAVGDCVDFYVINTDRRESGKGYQREYKILSAHETYPGHHLLDIHRWSLKRPFRRAVKQPVFYEGWACFAEELMRLTGYFSKPGDLLLLARRRLLHALRAKVDIGLQTGIMDIPAAIKFLEANGIGTERATSLARKYPLNPGYQLCYTLGLRRFWQLFEQYGRENLPGFVSEVLNQGEIHFSDLEKVFQKH